MSSILQTIVNLKRNLVSLSENNWDRLNKISDGLGIDESITVPNGDGFYATFSHSVNGFSVAVKDRFGESIGSILNKESINDIINTDTIFKSEQDNSFTDVNDLVSNAAYDAQIYDVLAIVTDGYKVNTRQSIDAITTALSGYIDDTAKFNSLKSDLAGLADNNGLISNMAWLTFIQSICNKANNNLSANGFDIDATAPMYISCLWTTIAAEALPLIGELIQWIASCIGGIIGIIGVAVGAIVSFVGRLFGQVVRPEYTVIDADANTPLLKEVPFALTPHLIRHHGTINRDNMIVIEDAFVSVGETLKYDMGFIEHYCWPNKIIHRLNDENVLKPLQTDFCFNSFLSFKLNPIKTINWIFNNLIYVSGPNADNQYSFTFRNQVNNYWSIPTECEWTVSELLQMQQGDSAMIQSTAWGILLCLSLSLLNVADYFYDPILMEDNDNIQIPLDYYLGLTGATKQQYTKGVVACGISTIQYLYRKCQSIINANFEDLDGVYADNNNFPTVTCETLTTLIYILNNDSLFRSQDTSLHSFSWLFTDTSSYTHNSLDYPNLPRFDLPSFHWNPMWHFFDIGEPYYDDWEEYYNLSGEAEFLKMHSQYADRLSKEDFIPTVRAFACENTTMSEVIWTIVATATLVVAGMVAGALIKTKLKKRKMRKRLDATNAMNQATSDYQSGAISFDDYYKQLKSYNRKARWFGYPSYDPCNKWFDYGSGSGHKSDSLDIRKITNLITG